MTRPKARNAPRNILITGVALMVLALAATIALPAIHHAPTPIQPYLEYTYKALMASAVVTWAIMALLFIITLFQIAFQNNSKGKKT